jgi:hypothetical protein
MDETPAPQITEPGDAPVEQPSETAPTGTAEKLLPQSQVNALIAQARREGAASAAKKTPSPAATPTPTAPVVAPDPVAALTAEIQEIKLRGTFDRLAIKAGIDDATADDLFDLFKAQRPADPHAWIGEKAQRFGLGRKPAPSTTTVSTQASAPVPGQPAPTPAPVRVAPTLNAPAPGDQRDAEAVLLNRPLDANGHDFDRLVAIHGPDKAMQMWSSHVRTYLRGVKLVPDSRRQR